MRDSAVFSGKYAGGTEKHSGKKGRRPWAALPADAEKEENELFLRVPGSGLEDRAGGCPIPFCLMERSRIFSGTGHGSADPCGGGGEGDFRGHARRVPAGQKTAGKVEWLSAARPGCGGFPA